MTDLDQMVKCDQVDDKYCHRHRSTNFETNKYLAVFPAQIAVFTYEGKIYDSFDAGAFSLKVENLPLLSEAIDIPREAGKQFSAELWFVNQLSKALLPWSTPTQMEIVDPETQIALPMRASGTFTLTCTNGLTLFKSARENITPFNADSIESYYVRKIVRQIGPSINKFLAKKEISTNDIDSHREEIVKYCERRINKLLENHGLSIEAIVFTTFEK